jgi:hypothetical protein
MSYVEVCENAALRDFRAADSEAAGDGMSINMKLVSTALEIIFQSQQPDGTWRKGEPIVADVRVRRATPPPPSSQGSSDSRDIGNAYVFFIDLVGSLLETLLRCEPERAPELLGCYVPNLERSVMWLEENTLSESLSGGVSVGGWRSNHLGGGGPLAWCTAQVFATLG